MPSFAQVLLLLWEQAQEGSVTPTAALARELRALARAEESTPEDELEKILRAK
jgi:hypothetical protein